MSSKPVITSIEVHEFWYDVQELGPDEKGFNSIYTPGATSKSTTYMLKINSSAGVSGEIPRT